MIKDLQGQKFFRLLVISEIEKRQKGKVKWFCLCDCGNYCEKLGTSLVCGITRSCGCYRKEVVSKKNKEFPIRKYKDNQSAKNRLYKTYKNGAIQRGYDFLLTKEELLDLTSRNCYYCGDSPKQTSNSYTSLPDYIYNGIDRINNSLGYNLDNCVPCCKICNVAKGSRLFDDFVEWLERVKSFQQGIWLNCRKIGAQAPLIL